MEHTFNLQTTSDELHRFREEFKKLLVSSGLDERAQGQMVLAMDEVLANVSRHGYKGSSGEVEIKYDDFDDRLEVLIKDRGVAFDPTQVPDPKLPPTKAGGLGIYFIKCVVDTMKYQSRDGFNELFLVKHKSERGTV